MILISRETEPSQVKMPIKNAYKFGSISHLLKFAWLSMLSWGHHKLNGVFMVEIFVLCPQFKPDCFTSSLSLYADIWYVIRLENRQVSTAVLTNKCHLYWASHKTKTPRSQKCDDCLLTWSANQNTTRCRNN